MVQVHFLVPPGESRACGASTGGASNIVDIVDCSDCSQTEVFREELKAANLRDFPRVEYVEERKSLPTWSPDE